MMKNRKRVEERASAGRSADAAANVSGHCRGYVRSAAAAAKYVREAEDMAEGKIYIYGGTGHGKSPAAIGCGLIAAAKGANVVIIQFLRGKGLTEDSYARRLEPEIKLFRFEKSDVEFGSLPKEKQEDEVKNIRNGLNYAKKVLSTGECDMLILDEVLGLIGNGIITVEDLKNVLGARDGETDVIMTGVPISSEICSLADYVTEIRTVK